MRRFGLLLLSIDLCLCVCMEQRLFCSEKNSNNSLAVRQKCAKNFSVREKKHKKEKNTSNISARRVHAHVARRFYFNLISNAHAFYVASANVCVFCFRIQLKRREGNLRALRTRPLQIFPLHFDKSLVDSAQSIYHIWSDVSVQCAWIREILKKLNKQTENHSPLWLSHDDFFFGGI